MTPDLDPAPLATEALRGEGAYLINKAGERFMVDVHESAELAPRDIVARAVDRELKSGRGAFLDCATTIGKSMKNHFPTVIDKCKEVGIDPTKEPIPIAPAAHFQMGGIVTDANGRSTNRWALGLRRGSLYRPTWWQSTCFQLIIRSCGFRQPNSKRY